jgi:hypothetical protein
VSVDLNFAFFACLQLPWLKLKSEGMWEQQQQQQQWSERRYDSLARLVAASFCLFRAYICNVTSQLSILRYEVTHVFVELALCTCILLCISNVLKRGEVMLKFLVKQRIMVT